MSERPPDHPAAAAKGEQPPIYFNGRSELALHYLQGSGIEIGALHQPLLVSPQAEVRYVDRMTVEELRSEYPELADWNLTRVDIIDDGERLSTIPDASQDFIIANHFLEHCEDPIGTIGVHLSKLKPGGVLFYAVPDKRYTFDFRRSATDLEHMILDHEHGPERSRSEHYEEWASLVTEDESARAPAQTESDESLARRASELEEAGYSIHMHTWTQAEFLQLLLHCRERSGSTFDIEAAARQSFEFMVVLRKQGRYPLPNATGLVAENERLEMELRGVRQSLSWRLTAPLRTLKRILRAQKQR